MKNRRNGDFTRLIGSLKSGIRIRFCNTVLSNAVVSYSSINTHKTNLTIYSLQADAQLNYLKSHQIFQ